jgi:hypothetical protein
MSTKTLKILWGIILFLLLGLSFACLAGYVPFDCFAGWMSEVIFISLSIISFLSYFISGTKNWGWLFPAFLSAALALNAGGVFSSFGGPIVAFPILLSLAIPCYVGYFLNRKQWSLLIPAWILTLIAITPPLLWIIDENLLTAIILYSISLPFMVGYLTSPECKWSLFIAAFFGFLGVFSLIESLIHGAVWGPAILLLLALPFLVFSYQSKKNRWALIPVGILTTIGVMALVNRLLPAYDYISIGEHSLGIYTGLLFLGLAITFGIAWRLNTNHRQDWTRYAAAACLVLSLLAFLTGEDFTAVLPIIAFLIIGAVIVFDSIHKVRANRQLSP